MNNIFAIWFGFPSIVVLVVLAFIGIYSTLHNVIIAFRFNDYEYLTLFFILTISAFGLGWVLGDFL